MHNPLALPLAPRLDSRSDISPDVETLLLGFREHAAEQPSHREIRVEALLAATFLAAALTLAFAAGGFAAPAWEAPVLLAAYAVASRVTFPVGAAYTVPTQLVFVPMLVLLPPASVPLLVAAGIILAHLPDYARGRTSPLRALLVPGDAWHAVGPAVVLVAAQAGPLGWGDWPLLVAALAAQVAVDVVVTAVRLRLGVGESLRLHLELASWAYAVDVLLSPAAFVVAVAAVDRPWLVLTVLPLVAVLSLFARERAARIDQALELSRAYRGTTLLLGDVLEGEHGYTGEHSRDVVALAGDVARQLDLDDRRRRLVEFGALLHDVGKIAVPKEILDKPGPLTDEEWLVIRTHTVIGQRMLDRVGGLLGEVGRVVRSCHERWDGGGYPDGLRGEEIPLEAAIVCCCDAYHAMTSDRPYRRAMAAGDAIGEVCLNAGLQFAPRVADALACVVEGGERARA